jgi:hypothetical protein
MTAPTEALPAQLTPWITQAQALVAGKIEDAAAHAEKVLTARLKGTPDGRPTARLQVKSRSYKAAESRLLELRTALIGPTPQALTGLLRDARAAFFAEAFGLWKPLLDPDYYNLDVEPTQQGRNTARGAIIHGIDLYREMAGVFEPARRGLFTAVNLAAGLNTPHDRAAQIIETWRKQSTDRISQACAVTLSDSQLALFYAVEHAIQKEPTNAVQE